MEVRRIAPETGIADLFKNIDDRLRQQENKPTGNVVVRDSISAIDPETGVEVVFGALPDGTVGFDPWVNDITPPDKPSTPKLTSITGIYTITWDGLDATGLIQPKDYSRTGIQISNDGLTDWREFDFFRGKGTCTLTGEPYAVARYFRLVSYDVNKNASVPSAIASLVNTSSFDDTELQEQLEELEERTTDAEAAASAAQGAAGAAQIAADQAKADALAASGLAAGKGKIVYSTSAPTGADANTGTLWIDTTGNKNTPKRWTSGTTWVAITDQVAVDAAKAAADANAAILTKTTTYYGTSATATTIGDLWVDTTLISGVPGNVLKRWSGSAWITVQDKKLQDALTAAGTAQSTADGKIKTFAQVTAPAGLTSLDVGDLWIDTDDGNKLYRWQLDGGTYKWVAVQDTAIAAAAGLAASANQKAVDANDAALAASGLAGSKSKVIYSTTAPTGVDANANTLWIDTTNNANTPKKWVSGTTWTAVTDKVATDAASLAASANAAILTKTTTFYGTSATATAAGDLWVDTTLIDGAPGNVLKRWSGSTWVTVQDKKLQDALKAAGDAQSTADGKIKTYAQTTPPTGLVAKDVGDIWIDTNNGNKLWRWQSDAGTFKWVVVQDTAIAAAAGIASQARQAAIDANQAAIDAAGIATAKGKVIVQATAPDVADQNNVTLWIDTNGTANTPKRWDGVRWVAITDKVATDAATAAGTAQDKADIAFNKAVVAAENAGLAQDAADGKARVWYQDAAPTGTNHKSNDIWFKSPNNTVNRWDSTTNEWKSIQDKDLVTATSSITDLQSSVNGKNKIINSTANASGTAGYVTGDRWQKWSTLAVGGKLLATWRFTTVWVAEELDATYLPLVDIGSGTFGELNGSRLLADSILADKVVVGGAGNMHPDSAMIDTEGWNGVPAANGSVEGIGTGKTGGRSFLIPASTGTQYSYYSDLNKRKWMPTTANTEYRVRCWIRAGVNVAAGGVRIFMRSSSPGGVNFNASADAPALSANVWTEVVVVLKTGPDTTLATIAPYIASGTSSAVRFSDFSVQPMSNGELIVKGSITAESGIIGSLDIGKVTLGTLHGSYIEGRSITTSQLLIGSMDNMLSEPEFNGNLASWGGISAPTFTVDPTGSRSGGTAMKILGSTSQSGRYNVPEFSVEEGAVYRMTAWVKSTVVIPSNGVSMYFRRRLLNGTTPNIWIVSAPANTPANTWVKITGTYEIPAGVVAGTVGVFSQANLTSGHLLIDSISCVRAADGSLIVDGSIDGKTITGAKFQTDSSATKGIKLDSLGFRAYNLTGIKTFGIDALTGEVSTIGTFISQNVRNAGTSSAQTLTAVFGILDDADYAGMPGLSFSSNKFPDRKANLTSDGTFMEMDTRNILDAVTGSSSSATANIGPEQSYISSLARQPRVKGQTLLPAGPWGKTTNASIYAASGASFDSRGSVTMDVTTTDERSSTYRRQYGISADAGLSPNYFGQIQMYVEKEDNTSSFRGLFTDKGFGLYAKKNATVNHASIQAFATSDASTATNLSLSATGLTSISSATVQISANSGTLALFADQISVNYTKITLLADPTSGTDAANKQYVDGAGTSNATVNTLVRRNTDGRAQVAEPSAAADIATKRYVDLGDARVEYVEYTSTFSLASGNNYSTGGALTVVSQVNNDFATVAGNGTVSLNAGVYAITFTASIGTGFGTGGGLQMSGAGGSVGQDAVATSWGWAIFNPTAYVSVKGNQSFQVRQLSGASRSCTTNISIVKIK